MKSTIKELNGYHSPKEIELKVEFENGTLMISKPDDGYDRLIVALEIWEGEFRALVWPDVDDEDSGPITVKFKEKS
jgi:hypothetical protein